MSYSAVITHVRDGHENAPRLACAVAVARRFGARLIGLGAELIPPLAFDSGYGAVDGDWVRAMSDSVEQNLRRARIAFDTATEGFAAQDRAWLCGLQSPTPALAEASRAADLIVAGGGPRRGLNAYSDVSAADIALQAGRPVLVAAAGAPPLTARRVVVAWKDSREARRALSDALPFLEAAERVRVLEVHDDTADEDARIRTRDVVAALARRGVVAEASAARQGREAASERILESAAAFGADLIVLGCYGHSRLGEWVFGGVTADLLARDDVYLLLSH